MLAMDRPAWILPALLGVMLSSQMVHAADPEPPIDWDKARQLYQREQKGQKLTADEQAYLDRAKTERRPDHPSRRRRPDAARIDGIQAADGDDHGRPLQGRGRRTLWRREQ
jgi:hypothetical protein